MGVKIDKEQEVLAKDTEIKVLKKLIEKFKNN